MKRNWDIVREILLRLESSETANTVLNARDLKGYDEQEVGYNMRLLDEAGYIKARVRDSSTGDGLIVMALAMRLTNPGHDLLDTIRSESVWVKVKEHFKGRGVEMTFDFVISVGKSIVERMLLD